MSAPHRSLPIVRRMALVVLAMSGTWHGAPLAAQALPHVTGAGPDRPAAWREVAGVLEHGARSWNGGDLDGFVSDYTPDATFVTSRGLVRGTAEIRERYAARFAPGALRDSLSFRVLDVDVLGRRTANLVAIWVLARGDSVTSTGPTSLVLKKVGGRWKIAHDHSS